MLEADKQARTGLKLFFYLAVSSYRRLTDGGIPVRMNTTNYYGVEEKGLGAKE